jgi:hypothetical protein
MTSTPYLGKRVVWQVCTAPGEAACSDYEILPSDTDPVIADWGDATAAFGDADQYKVYGKRVSAILVERVLNPLYNPVDPDLYPQYIENIINTHTVRIDVDTNQRDQIHPAIEIYDGESPTGAQTVAGLIDGTYYVYPVVFQDAQFCYQRRCASSYPSGSNTEVCLSGNAGFPLEPYDPDCNPPIYPMDSITAFVPSQQSQENIRYSAVWSYYDLSVDPGQSNLLTSTIYLDMTVNAPANDWIALMRSMMEYTYFYNGIYH